MQIPGIIICNNIVLTILNIFKLNMKTEIYYLIATFVLVLSCKKDCNECFSPPQPLLFELVDKEYGYNLISNGSITSVDIKISNSLDNHSLGFNIIKVDDKDLISLNSIGWKTETTSCKFIIFNEAVFTVQVEAKRMTDDCCTHTKYEKIQVELSDNEIYPTNGIYKILMD